MFVIYANTGYSSVDNDFSEYVTHHVSAKYFTIEQLVGISMHVRQVLCMVSIKGEFGYHIFHTLQHNLHPHKIVHCQSVIAKFKLVLLNSTD